MVFLSKGKKELPNLLLFVRWQIYYRHSNSDGLQVRLDYAVMTGGGMSDAQMLTTLGRGIKHILHGIDDISRESVGNSPVEWP